MAYVEFLAPLLISVLAGLAWHLSDRRHEREIAEITARPGYVNPYNYL